MNPHPTSRDKRGRDKPGHDADTSRHARLRILIVDDSDLQLQFGQMLLAREDFECLTARDGAEAIAAARAQRPDLILLDIEMPVMNGLEAVLRIREDPAIAGIPVIMVTGRGSAEHMEKAFIGGCNDYVLKPIHKEELLGKIRALTGYAGGGNAR